MIRVLMWSADDPGFEENVRLEPGEWTHPATDGQRFYRAEIRTEQVVDVNRTLTNMLAMLAVVVGTDANGDIVVLPALLKGHSTSTNAPPTPAVGMFPAPTSTEPAGYTDGYTAFAAFDPPVTNTTPAAGTPQIAEFTRQAQPGDAIALTGEDLADSFVFWGTGHTSTNASLLLDGQQCALALPSGLPASDMYLLWPTNASGHGPPVALNKTEAWWVGPDKVTTNEVFAVYGQNLGADTKIWISGHGLVANNGTSNPYRVEFALPALSTGTHDVYVHNNKGREYGWDGPLSITVWEGFQWNDDTNTWVYVQQDHGAVGDGTTDDYNAIVAALTAADATNWNTVYFEPGIYRINTTIADTLTNLRIKGAGNNLVTLLEKDNGITGTLLRIDFTNCAIEDMTIKTDDGALNATTLLNFNGVAVDNLHFSRVVFSQLDNAATATSADGIFACNGDDEQRMFFTDCTFYTQGPPEVKNSQMVLFKNCEFYGLNEANQQVSIRYTTELAFEDCIFRQYDYASGLNYVSSGRALVFQPATGAPRNVYYGGNETVEHSYHAGDDSNAAENILVENRTVDWWGVPTSASDTTLVFANDAPLPSNIDGTMYWGNYLLQVAAGKGKGQSRYVVSCNVTTGTFTVDKPWNVQPDATSTIYAVAGAYHFVIYDNTFDGIAAMAGGSGNTAVSFYGPSHGNVVDGNRVTDVNEVFVFHSEANDSVPSISTPTNLPQAIMFNLVQNNSSSNTITGFRVGDKPEDNGPLAPGVANLGLVFRNNALTDIVGDLPGTEGNGIQYWFKDYKDVPNELIIFQNNSFTNVAQAMIAWVEPTGNDTYYYTLQGGFTNLLYIGNTTNGAAWSP